MSEDVKNLSFEQKLTVLKRMHARSAPEAKMQIMKWDDELSRLRMQGDWLKHPNTKELRQILAEQLDRIVSVLANDETLLDVDRKAYFRTKDVVFSLLAVLTSDPESQMKAIEDQVDKEL